MRPARRFPKGLGRCFARARCSTRSVPFTAGGAGAELVIGLRVAEKHTNSRGIVHGGVLATIGDIALGYTMASSADPPRWALTASLTIDYIGAARIDDWIEARVDKCKVGKTLAFANAYLTVADAQIARVSAVFAMAQSPAS